MDELKDGRAWGFCSPVLLRKKEKRCKFNVSPIFYLMPQTGIEPFFLISNTDRKGL